MKPIYPVDQALQKAMDRVQDASNYAAENAAARRKETRETAIYAFMVFGVMAAVATYVFFWSWE